MNLYLISQDANTGYDTYDSAVVCAETEEEARLIHPSFYGENWNGIEEGSFGTWTNSINVKVALIGKAVEGITKRVILSSFNAG